VDNALALYYDRSVHRAAAASEGRIGEGELRRWFGTALITATGTRGLAFRGAPGATWRIPGLALKELEEAHVIRREDRSGTITHELTHDRFIEPIQKSNHKWLDGYQAAERVRAKLEECAKRESDELLDEVELREAEEYLNSPEAKILGASPEARQLVKRSRKELDETKKRQAEELEKALQRAREQEQLRKAESERVGLLLEKRKRERIFSVTIFLLGITMVIALAGLGYVLHQKWQLAKQDAAATNERGKRFREKAKADLADKANPIRDVNALRNLAIALSFNLQDIEAAKMTRDLLLQHVWCPPVASEVRYRQDALLAATFAPGGSNNEIFAAVGDGQLQVWDADEERRKDEKRKEREPPFVRRLFDKPVPDDQHIVQAGLASFSPDGRWLLIIPPTLVLAASADAGSQVGPQQGSGLARASSGVDLCSVQPWRWSAQNHTYERAGPDLNFNRLRGSRMISIVWSPESDRLVILNTRMNETECVLFKVNGNTFQELPDQSKTLREKKVVALAFTARPSPEHPAESIPGYENRNAIAVVTVDPPPGPAVTGGFAAPAVRRVSFIAADDLKVIPDAMKGESIPLAEGFQPNAIGFGPGNNQLTLTSWGSIRILNIFDGKLTPLPPPTFRDQFMRIVMGPGDFATRLVATSLYGRVEVAKGTQMRDSAEPVIFGGSIGSAQFSSDGQRLLILSGGIWNVFDRMRLIDVSPLYRTLKPAPETLEEKPVPPWLADIASAASALDAGGDGSLLTLESVRQKYPGSKAGVPYEAVWKRFFPD
jgi:hypothetical protein